MSLSPTESHMPLLATQTDIGLLAGANRRPFDSSVASCGDRIIEFGVVSQPVPIVPECSGCGEQSPYSKIPADKFCEIALDRDNSNVKPYRGIALAGEYVSPRIQRPRHYS